MTSTSTNDLTLGDLVTARPAAARVLEHRLDYCGGRLHVHKENNVLFPAVLREAGA